MTSSLSNLTDNLAEGLRQGKCEKYVWFDYATFLGSTVNANVSTATKVIRKSQGPDKKIQKHILVL